MNDGCAIRAAISPMCLAEVMAIRNAVFMDRCKREQVALDLEGGLVQALRTRLKSQAGAGDVTWGKRVPIPLKSLRISG